jgi:hypothetical protein
VWGDFDAKGNPRPRSRGDRIIPCPMPYEYLIASVNGHDVQYDPHLPPIKGDADALHLVTPEEAMLFDICRNHPEKVFLSNKGLAKLAPPDAVPLFQFDDFEWPAAGAKASSSIDIVTMVEALRTRKKIAKLPGKANSHPEAWMLGCSKLRFFAGGNAWAPSDHPIARPRPTKGVGKTPYQNLLFERGFPHCVQLLHGEQHESEAGVAAAFQVLFANPGSVPPYWSRRTATAWVRAVCTGEREEAIKDARPIHPAEARVLLKALSKLPAYAAAQVILILEALIGGDETILALATVLKGDSPALAAAAFEATFVLMRIPEKPHRCKNDPQRAEVRDRREVRAALAKAKVSGDTKRMLAIALGKADMLKERQDGPFDAYLVTLGGDAYLKRVKPRVTNDPWTRYQLGMLRSKVAAEIEASFVATP